MKLENSRKQLILWDKCTKVKELPSDTISMYELERNLGISFKDIREEELEHVLYGKRRGQFGFFLPLQVVESIKSRQPVPIPGDWLSEKLLAKSLERKDGYLLKGDMARYRSKWGRYGCKEGQTGGSKTWFFPVEFLIKEIGVAVITKRSSVTFLKKNYGMKGLALDSLPMKPMSFKIVKGKEKDVIIDSGTEESDSEDDGVLNDAVLEES